MIEDDDMRAVFFDADEFGDAVTFTPNDGTAPFTINCIFDSRAVGERQLKGAQPQHWGDAQISGNSPQARCRTSDVDGKVKAGRCTALVRGRTYNVFDMRPDNTGMSLLILKVA